ncbi:MAG: helix-turn-helix domain-containing protein [Lachnospiraceae bacterium]
MPLPLKPGYNFNFERIVRPPHYEMPTADAYTDFYGISYMISGERLIYSPDFTTIVKAGELVFIPKNIYRRTTYISNEPYERILLKFTDGMITDLLNTIGVESFNELCQEHVLRFEKKAQDKILSILEEMEQEWNSYNRYSELLLKGLLNKLIITCLREHTIHGINILSLEKKHDCLANSIKYIKAHLRDNPTLEETARNNNISASYLSKIFVSYLNTPFSAFVLNEKISHAQKLLVNTKLSMSEVAAESGFSSNSYFSDCFKRSVGISPLQFRKNNASL